MLEGMEQDDDLLGKELMEMEEGGVKGTGREGGGGE